MNSISEAYFGHEIYSYTINPWNSENVNGFRFTSQSCASFFPEMAHLKRDYNISFRIDVVAPYPQVRFITDNENGFIISDVALQAVAILVEESHNHTYAIVNGKAAIGLTLLPLRNAIRAYSLGLKITHCDSVSGEVNISELVKFGDLTGTWGMDYVNALLATRVLEMGNFIFMDLSNPNIDFHDDYLSVKGNIFD